MLLFEFVVLLIVSLVLFYCAWWYVWRIVIDRWWLGGPPGPLGLPFVGSFPWVRSDTAHITLTRWAQLYGPLFSFYQGSKLVVVLADARVIDSALVKQADVFSGRPFLMGVRPKTMKPKHGINSAEGPLWKEQRRFVVSTLRDLGLGRGALLLEGRIVEEAESLLESIAATKGAAFDPRPAISNAVSNVICSLVFGHRFGLDDSELKDQLDRLNYRASRSGRNTLSAQSIFPTLYQHYYPPGKRQLKQFIQDGEEIMTFLQREIDACRRRRGSMTMEEEDGGEGEDEDDKPKCLVEAFFKAQAQGRGDYFTDTQLRSLAFDLFLAGTDTTASTLRWALYYLAKDPAAGVLQDRVRAEIHSVLGTTEGWPSWTRDRARLPMVEATLMEVHRMASIVPLSVMHRTSADTKLDGYRIPEGAYVIPLLWAVHRGDPKQYPRPDEFDPYRFIVDQDGGGVIKLKDSHLIPFSVGKRACPGEPLARMELFVYFTAMIQRFRFTLVSEEEGDAEQRCTVGFIRSPGAFRVRAEPVSSAD